MHEYTNITHKHAHSPSPPGGRGLGRGAGVLWAVQSGSLKKHDSAPVWQAGPAGFTRSSTVSASQSSRVSITSIRFPEVPPFSHRPRVREWKHALPGPRVFVPASSSM